MNFGFVIKNSVTCIFTAWQYVLCFIDGSKLLETADYKDIEYILQYNSLDEICSRVWPVRLYYCLCCWQHDIHAAQGVPSCKRLRELSPFMEDSMRHVIVIDENDILVYASNPLLFREELDKELAAARQKYANKGFQIKTGYTGEVRLLREVQNTVEHEND